MSTTLLISMIGLLSVLSAIYTGYDLWRRRQASSSIDVVSSAVQLLKPYKAEVAQLRKDLSDAQGFIDALKAKLALADARAEELNLNLKTAEGTMADAKVELGYLRMQVRMMTDQLKAAGTES